MADYRAEEIASLIREVGWVRASEILAERKKAAEEQTQGEASELSESDWRAAIEANRGKKS
jgi:hypothetical protein